jgi:hypothetical protein
MNAVRMVFALRKAVAAAGVMALLGVATTAAAADFAVAVSPPRFEVQMKPGERTRQILEITNSAPGASSFKVKTADWTLAPDGSVTFEDALRAGSCRPWVTLERRELTVQSGRPYRFRFEISPPADAPAAECRFALLLEGEDQTAKTASLAIPYNARLGVIVYVGIGNVVPRIEIIGGAVQNVNGRPTAVLKVKNTGTAHGRLSGFLSGTDAGNTSLEFAPTPSPILPGESRDIPLTASRPGDPDTPVTARFPVTVRGNLESGSDQSQAMEQRFTP